MGTRLPAILTSGGRSLELAIVGYQFPGADGRSTEASLVGVGKDKWLRIRTAVRDELRSWESIDACLTDVEAIEIADLARRLAHGEISSIDFFAIEPNIEVRGLRSVDATIELIFSFDHELHPLRPDYRRGRYDVVFTPTAKQLIGFSDALSAQVRGLPD
jgi:hypothetical protein